MSQPDGFTAVEFDRQIDVPGEVDAAQIGLRSEVKAVARLGIAIPLLIELAKPQIELIFLVQYRAVEPAGSEDWFTFVRFLDTSQHTPHMLCPGDHVVVDQELFLHAEHKPHSIFRRKSRAGNVKQGEREKR